MTIIRIISLAIFIITCLVIYHNVNSFEIKTRIGIIVIAMIVMYIITSIICQINLKEIKIQNENAINSTLDVIKMIFTPINAMIVASPIGNLLGKLKENTITIDKARRKTIILILAIVIVFIFETNYIRDFITNLLRLV